MLMGSLMPRCRHTVPHRCSAGTLKHHKWADDQIHKMVRDQHLRITYHRMCHFDVRVEPSQAEPSESSIAIAATVDLPEHPCVCKPGMTHVRDWGVKPASSQDKPRWRALCAMAQKVIEDCVKQGVLRTVPDLNYKHYCHRDRTQLHE